MINTKNNPDLNIWNGTTGTVHEVDIDGKLWLKLDIPIIDIEKSKNDDIVYKDMVLLDKDAQKELRFAYALTVHKSQGSQYRKVCFICLNRDYFMLERALTYTAVTRTQQDCIIVGQLNALRASLSMIKSKETVIQNLIQGS